MIFHEIYTGVNSMLILWHYTMILLQVLKEKSQCKINNLHNDFVTEVLSLRYEKHSGQQRKQSSIAFTSTEERTCTKLHQRRNFGIWFYDEDASIRYDTFHTLLIDGVICCQTTDNKLPHRSIRRGWTIWLSLLWHLKQICDRVYWIPTDVS